MLRMTSQKNADADADADADASASASASASANTGVLHSVQNDEGFGVARF